ncbi:hypothetical protein [Aureimonas mangrovi]|uniref:hypothetical protein n=1 Tax=Aureimonas mangrovi TaxID=2758041 RepID=UPI00163D6E3F|nr:hypothetical protein [Aureimonas mangrovi]
MSEIVVTVLEEPPEPDRDLEIKIDFVEDGSAARVFTIASELIAAFEGLDRVLLSSVDSRIETSLILEDVRKSSLRVFLRNFLKSLDDEALKTLDWKKQLGIYLVSAKYLALEWLDRPIEDGEDAGVEDLAKQIRKLAEETDVRHLPDYPPILPSRLAQSLDQVQRTKERFRPGEGLTIVLGEDEYRVDVSKRWLPSEHLPPERTEELSNDLDIVFVVRKPDLLGDAQWGFRHRKHPISASIRDLEWLEKFRKHEVLVLPGDALRVRARYTYRYDQKGEVTEEKVEILKVYGVIRAAEGSAPDMFDNE